ncbi:MAG: ABC transporter substrate-binding protein [Actinomycetota bacterium]
MSLRRGVANVLCVVVLVATAASCTGAKGDIVIGVVGPLSGPLAFVGEAQRRGAEIAANAINDEGGIKGRKVRLAVRDDADFSRITGILRDLTLREKAIAIVGPETATPVLSASSPTARAKVPVLLPYAAHGDVRPRGAVDNVYRLVPSAADESALISDWLVKQRRMGSIAIATAADEDGRGAAALLKRSVPAAGGRVVAAREFTPGEIDQTQLAQTLKRSGASALIVWGPPADAARVAQAVRRVGWNAQIAGPLGLFVSDYRSLAGTTSDGTAITLPFRRDWFSARVAAFFLRYQTRFGIVTIPKQRTLIPDLPVLAMAAHDAVVLAADAARRAGASPAKVNEALQRTKDVEGISRTYTFTPQNHEAFGGDDLWMARFYNFAVLYDVDRRADRAEQIAFYKIQVSAIYVPPEFFRTAKGAELQQRILEEVLTNPEKVEFFKAYRPPRPPPGPI